MRFTRDEGYEVDEGRDRHVVCFRRKICTCRLWDLTGIPCQHGVSAYWHAKEDPKVHISRFYHKETYISTYRTKFEAVKGQQFWRIDSENPLLPPPIVPLPGRPTVKRKRTEVVRRRVKICSLRSPSEVVEGQTKAPSEVVEVEKLSTVGRILKCSVCRKEGHNKSTCAEVYSFVIVMTFFCH